MLFVLNPHRSQSCETLRLNSAYPALKIPTARNPTARKHLTIKTCSQIIGILYVDRL